MTKRIFLFTSYPLWSETFIRQDLFFLQKLGLDMVPAALYPGDCQPQADWPKATILQPDAPAAKPPANPSLKTRLAKLLPSALHTRLSLRTHAQLVQRLKNLAIQTQANHIHAEFADLAAIVAAEVARQLKITYSLGLHAFDVHATKFDLPRLLKGASFIAICNQAAADACVQMVPSIKPKLHLIYHGVNLEHWQLQPTHSFSPQQPQLLFIGRLVPKKGIPILLEAMNLLNSKGIRPKLTIVGQGPLKEQLQKQATELNLQDSLTWTGVLQPQEIRQLMSQMDCLCAPSVITPDGDRDGIPNVILEAMASGLPVIASQVGSLGEAVTPETGFPIQQLTPQNLAETITTLCVTASAELEHKRQNARRLIEDHFDAAKLAQTRADCFRHLP